MKYISFIKQFLRNLRLHILSYMFYILLICWICQTHSNYAYDFIRYIT